MIWSTNYGRLLCQTVFTLFFAGRDFAPLCIIDGVNIQDWLQLHFIKACGQLAARIKQFDGGRLFEECVIGWDSMNEPFEGLCEWDDLNANPTAQGSTLKKGTHPTPAQSLRLGMGQAQTVENYTFGMMGPQRDGSVTIDPKGYKIWGSAEEIGELENGTHPKWGWTRDVSKWKLDTCIWAMHGVWDIETGFILLPDYFKFRPINGEMEEVSFLSDYWKPHWLAYSAHIRAIHPEAIICIQPPVFAPPPPFTEAELKGRCAYTPHYYDGLTLVSKHWNWFNADALGLLRGRYKTKLAAVKIGGGAIRKSLRQQIGYLLDDVGALGDTVELVVGPNVRTNASSTSFTVNKAGTEPIPLGKYPTIIGEIGTPFDMDNKRSYGYSSGGQYLGNYSSQQKALDASLNACDGERACNWTVWTYVADDHSHEWGDGWNLEDLSLWSRDDLVERRGDDDDVKTKWLRFRAEKEEGLTSRAVLLGEEAYEFRGRRGRKTQQPTVSMPMTIRDPSSISVATINGSASVCPKGKPANGSKTTVSETSSSRHPSPFRKSLKNMYQSSHPFEGIKGYTTNPFIFLTNGARAVKAFARPWPVKVVGRPTSVEFDVAKGVFKLSVVVGAEDVPETEGLGEAEARATEVYLPLVHYAHQAIVDDALKIWTGPVEEMGLNARDLGGANTRMGIVTPTETDANTVVEIDLDSRIQSKIDLSLTANANANGIAKVADMKPTPCLIPDKYRLAYPPFTEVPLVDVDVRVSTGRFKLVGQRLLWWYDAPRQGEVEQRVEIEVRRRGGVLKDVDWRKVRGEVRRREGKGWCAWLCDADCSCIIM